MMTAERNTEGAELLTSKQKFDRIRPKMTIEVRLISAAKVDEKWLEARVVDKNKGGVFAKLTTSPLERFWHWNDVRLIEAAPSTSATIGEILRSHPAPDLPRREPMPAPPQLVAALVPRPASPAPLVRLAPPSEPRPAPILIRREDLKMPDNDQPETDPNRRFGRLPMRKSKSAEAIGSEVGAMVKTERLRRVLTQLDLAGRVNKITGATDASYNSRISRIEFGKSIPTDDELVAFAEVLQLDIAALIEANARDRKARIVADETARADAQAEERKRKDRERKRLLREEKAAAEGRAITPRILARVDPQLDRDPLRAEPRSMPPLAANAQISDLASLVEALIEIVPMPIDPARRKRWFQCASELFRISGGA